MAQKAPRPALALERPRVRTTRDGVTATARLGDRTVHLQIQGPRIGSRSLEIDSPFLIIGLAAAVARGADLTTSIGIRPTDRLNLVGALIPLLSELWGLPPIELRGPQRRARPIRRSSGVGLLFSAGIDSFYSLEVMRDSGVKPDALINVNAGAHDGDLDCWRNRLDNVGRVARRENIPLYSIDTDFAEVLEGPHVKSHTIRNLAASFVVAPEFGTLIYSSPGNFSQIDFEYARSSDISYIDHVTTSALTPAHASTILLGWDATRVEKTRRVAGSDLARDFLDVCADQGYQARIGDGRPRNCGYCAKCTRTIMTLEHLGSLDAFATCFDLGFYGANREEILARLSGSDALVDREVAALFLL